MPLASVRHGLLICFLATIAGFLPAQVGTPDSVDARRAQLAHAGLAQIGITTEYDPAYVKLDYPGGDVPSDRGVCTDVVIRALRGVNVDLQQLVHDDIQRAPKAYPHEWPGPVPDSNIDHRRVPNLMVFFHRQGRQLPASKLAADYLPGDIVVWRLPSGLLHVGLVTDRPAPGTDHLMMVHNIGHGAQCEDTLFKFDLVAHYRWFL